MKASWVWGFFWRVMSLQDYLVVIMTQLSNLLKAMYV